MTAQAATDAPKENIWGWQGSYYGGLTPQKMPIEFGIQFINHGNHGFYLGEFLLGLFSGLGSYVAENRVSCTGEWKSASVTNGVCSDCLIPFSGKVVAFRRHIHECHSHIPSQKEAELIFYRKGFAIEGESPGKLTEQFVQTEYLSAYAGEAIASSRTKNESQLYIALKAEVLFKEFEAARAQALAQEQLGTSLFLNLQATAVARYDVIVAAMAQAAEATKGKAAKVNKKAQSTLKASDQNINVQNEKAPANPVDDKLSPLYLNLKIRIAYEEQTRAGQAASPMATLLPASQSAEASSSPRKEVDQLAGTGV